jgi:hypothetical protein
MATGSPLTVILNSSTGTVSAADPVSACASHFKGVLRSLSDVCSLRQRSLSNVRSLRHSATVGAEAEAAGGMARGQSTSTPPEYLASSVFPCRRKSHQRQTVFLRPFPLGPYCQ